MQRHHSLLGIALVIFLVWVFFVFISRVVVWFIHILLIVAVIALILWLLRVIFGGRRRQQW